MATQYIDDEIRQKYSTIQPLKIIKQIILLGKTCAEEFKIQWFTQLGNVVIYYV